MLTSTSLSNSLHFADGDRALGRARRPHVQALGAGIVGREALGAAATTEAVRADTLLVSLGAHRSRVSEMRFAGDRAHLRLDRKVSGRRGWQATVESKQGGQVEHGAG